MYHMKVRLTFCLCVIGKRLAVMELRIMVAVLVLGFEFLPLEDETLNSMAGEERIFRRPQVCHVRLKAL